MSSTTISQRLPENLAGELEDVARETERSKSYFPKLKQSLPKKPTNFRF